jgi:hypothetical protein
MELIYRQTAAGANRKTDFPEDLLNIGSYSFQKNRSGGNFLISDGILKFSV